jgi:hypothetical protein
VKRDGARDAIVLINVRNLEFVEVAVLLQELPLYLDGLPIPLLLGAYAQVEGDPLRSSAGAVSVR